eukprot:13602272-Ditylum_brightwellii.AAC.3
MELDFHNKHEEVIKDLDCSSDGDSSIISGEDATTQESGDNDDETLPDPTIHQKDNNEIMCHDDESIEETNMPALKKQYDEDEHKLDSEDKFDDEDEDKDAPNQTSDVKLDMEIEEIYDELDAACSEKDNEEFKRILDHSFQKGTLIIKVRYYSETLVEDSMEKIPYSISKKYEPVTLAKYIKEHVVEKFRRNGFYNTWAAKVLKINMQVIKILRCIKEIDRHFRIKIIRRTKRERELPRGKDIHRMKQLEGIKTKISRNMRNQKKRIKEKI